MSLATEFADFVGSVGYRECALPGGRAAVWELGEGPPLLLLHGIAGSRRIFFRTAPILARRFRVLVPSLRGEDSPHAGFGFEDLLDDLSRLLEGLDLREATLCGVSFGGFLALAYAARRDPRVARVVAQGAFARFPLRWRERLLLAATRLLPAPLGAAYFAGRVRRGRETRRLEQAAPGLGAMNVAWTRATPFPTLRRRVRLIDRTDLAPRLAAGAGGVPILLAHGRSDRVVPFALFERLRALLPAARTQVWEEEGHLVPLSAPEKFSALL